MRAAVMRNSQLVVDTVPDPEPGPGEMLVKTLACGICGSDLHALTHAAQGGGGGARDRRAVPHRPVARHRHGPRVLRRGDRLRPGHRGQRRSRASAWCRCRCCSAARSIHGDRLLERRARRLRRADGALGGARAARPERARRPSMRRSPSPWRSGWHAVEKARLEPHDAALVVGCGPGRPGGDRGAQAAGHRADRRRRLLAARGARWPSAWARTSSSIPNARPLMEAWREVADLRPAVLFECVGVPGHAAATSCARRRTARASWWPASAWTTTRIRPMLGINKELSLQFVLGYTPGEFMDTLAAIADGRIDVAPLVTGRVGVEGVAQAFRDLASPDAAREDPGRALALVRAPASRSLRAWWPGACRPTRAVRTWSLRRVRHCSARPWRQVPRRARQTRMNLGGAIFPTDDSIH